jgi:hypothetical protein
MRAEVKLAAKSILLGPVVSVLMLCFTCGPVACVVSIFLLGPWRFAFHVAWR